jgi:hypothetical protein
VVEDVVISLSRQLHWLGVDFTDQGPGRSDARGSRSRIGVFRTPRSGLEGFPIFVGSCFFVFVGVVSTTRTVIVVVTYERLHIGVFVFVAFFDVAPTGARFRPDRGRGRIIVVVSVPQFG